MIKYNWQTRKWEVIVQFSLDKPGVCVCSFYKEQDALAYLSVRHVKC
jgi:hypothetical protein